MRDERKRVVAAGYDRMAGEYLDWAAQVEGDPRDRMVESFAGRLPPNGRVVDLGCGAGMPSTKALAERFDVVGVDFSQAQIALARENVPGASFIVGDITELELPVGSLDGVIALYSITHVPREEHSALYGRIFEWLRPGGQLLATLGDSDDPGWSGDWLGVPMFFSGFGADTNRGLLGGAGFQIEVDEIVTIREPEGEATFHWVIASKAGDAIVRA